MFWFSIVKTEDIMRGERHMTETLLELEALKNKHSKLFCYIEGLKSDGASCSKISKILGWS